MAEQTTQNITIQTEGKNLLAAYVIWFFLGTLGIHRIYIGRKGSGITMLVIFVLSLLSMIVFVGGARISCAGRVVAGRRCPDPRHGRISQ